MFKQIPEMNPFSSIASSVQHLHAALSTHYSPAQHLIAGRRGEALRRRGVENLLYEVGRLRSEKAPGLIRRTLLARALQNELLTAGYNAEFVRSVMPAILAELTRPVSAD